MKRLQKQRFIFSSLADDIALITSIKEELRKMLIELNSEAQKTGLNMNYNKANANMTNTDKNATISMGQETVEQVIGFIHIHIWVNL